MKMLRKGTGYGIALGLLLVHLWAVPMRVINKSSVFERSDKTKRSAKGCPHQRSSRYGFVEHMASSSLKEEAYNNPSTERGQVVHYTYLAFATSNMSSVVDKVQALMGANTHLKTNVWQYCKHFIEIGVPSTEHDQLLFKLKSLEDNATKLARLHEGRAERRIISNEAQAIFKTKMNAKEELLSLLDHAKSVQTALSVANHLMKKNKAIEDSRAIIQARKGVVFSTIAIRVYQADIQPTPPKPSLVWYILGQPALDMLQLHTDTFLLTLSGFVMITPAYATCIVVLLLAYKGICCVWSSADYLNHRHEQSTAVHACVDEAQKETDRNDIPFVSAKAL